MTNFSKPHPLATLSAGPPRALGRPLPGPAKPSRPVCSHSRTRTGSVSPRVYFFSDKDPSLLRCCREEPGRAARTREPGPRLRPRPVRSCAPGGGDGRRSLPFRAARPGPRLPPPQLGKHRASLLGPRLQHWNKTALFHFFFLFVHLNVYLELHFVKNFFFSF